MMPYRYKVALVFLIGFFIDCINIFMSAIALPSIAFDMKVSLSMVTWVTNSYILGLTLAIPISTWLAQRYGVRKLLFASMVIFTVAVGMCGLSNHFWSLILWRFIQGVGGGLLIPVGQALTFNLFQGQQRAKVSTIIMVVALIAPALSPMIGGAIVDHFTWRWVFFSNIPFSVIAAVLAWIWIKEEVAAEVEKPDIKGLILVSLILLSILLSISLYNQTQLAYLFITGLMVTLGLVALYLRHVKRAKDVIIDIRLLKNKNLSISVLVYYAIPGIFTGINILNIFYMQEVLHLSAEVTGRFMFIYAIGAFIAMIVGGRIYHKVGAKKLFIIGIGLHNLGIAILSLVNNSSGFILLILAYALMGIGGGVCANTAQTTALIDFKGQAMLKGSVIWNINRQVSFSIGVAALSLIFALLSQHYGVQDSYQITFIIGALLGMFSLMAVTQLPTTKRIK